MVAFAEPQSGCRALRERPTIEQIHNRGTLLVGSTGDYRPLSWYDPKTGHWEGFGIDVAERFALELGVNAEFVRTSWPKLAADVQSDPPLFDIAIGGITVTDVRNASMAMSKGYLANGKTILCRSSDAGRFRSLADIDRPDVRVMVNPGGLNEAFARSKLANARIIIHERNEDIPALVADGLADVMVTEVVEAPWYIRSDPRLAAPLIDKPFTHGEIGVLMRRGQDDLLAFVNDVIDRMTSDGSLDALKAKHGIANGESAAIRSDRTEGFVSLAEAVPDAILEIRYGSTYNFTGDRVDGYEEPCAILSKEAAASLKAASDEAVSRGYRLKIYDAYRPQRAVAHFMRWAKDMSDTRMKQYFYPDLDKSVLFAQGYIAERSGHSRGSTVDLTLFDMKTGKELDMGGTFDWFGKESHPNWRGVTDAQFANRMLLREIMTAHGFKPIDEEWWHFTLENEPYPNTYFDFPNKSEGPLEATPDKDDLPRLDALALDFDGCKIYGQILVPAKRFGDKRPCAIICHGFAGFTRWDDVAHRLCEAGVVVIIPHHRGAWGSGGEYTVSGCIDDAKRLVAFATAEAEKYGIDRGKVYLIGHSMGGNSVVNAARSIPGVSGVALIAPCDIGYMAGTMTKKQMEAFLVGEGMHALKRKSDEAIVDDVYANAAEMRFPKAVQSLFGRKVFLATGDYDTVVPTAPLDEFWTALGGDSSCNIRKHYRTGHSIMGARRQLAKDLIGFIIGVNQTEESR